MSVTMLCWLSVHNDVNIVGPEFNRDCWLNEKFNLGLDFPNVSETYIMYLLRIHVINN